MFRKLNNKQKTIRRRQQDKQDSPQLSDHSGLSASDAEEAKDELVMSTAQKRRQLRQKNMIQTTSKKRRRQLDNLRVSSSDESTEGETVAKFDPDVKFASSGKAERAGPSDLGATARSEIDADMEVDAQAQFERVQKMLKAAEAAEGTVGGDKIYRGMALYGAKIKQDSLKGNASSGLNRNGPIRASQFMRATVRWDYAPDVCKDYKETGYCTFGDSCKFMHDRSDYKHGWEIDRDYEAGLLKEAKDDEYAITSEDDDENEKELPSDCFICHNSFKNPHYFCESCALTQFRKSKKCAVCQTKIDGSFAIARAQMKAKNIKNEENDDSDDEQKPVEAAILPVADENDEIKLEPKEEHGEDVQLIEPKLEEVK